MDEQEALLLHGRVLDVLLISFYQWRGRRDDAGAAWLEKPLAAGRDDLNAALVLEVHDKNSKPPYPLRWLAQVPAIGNICRRIWRSRPMARDDGGHPAQSGFWAGQWKKRPKYGIMPSAVSGLWTFLRWHRMLGI